MTDWYTARGSIEPAVFDATSSKFYVYQRRNPQLVTLQNEFGGSSQCWQYEERKLTHGEFYKLQISQLEDENTNLQLALTELYENLLEG